MKKLSIPERITLTREFFPGFGAKELRRWLTATVPCLVITIAVCAGSRNAPGRALLAFLLFLAAAAALLSIFTRIDNQSIYTFLTKRIRFARKQQKFYYKHEKEVLHFAGEKTK